MYYSTLSSLRWYCGRFLRQEPSCIHCCRALALALARLSCIIRKPLSEFPMRLPLTAHLSASRVLQLKASLPFSPRPTAINFTCTAPLAWSPSLVTYATRQLGVFYLWQATVQQVYSSHSGLTASLKDRHFADSCFRHLTNSLSRLLSTYLCSVLASNFIKNYC